MHNLSFVGKFLLKIGGRIYCNLQTPVCVDSQIALFTQVEASDSDATMANFPAKATTNSYGTMPAKGKCRLRSLGKH
jgi:hypothetical protein